MQRVALDIGEKNIKNDFSNIINGTKSMKKQSEFKALINKLMITEQAKARRIRSTGYVD